MSKKEEIDTAYHDISSLVDREPVGLLFKDKEILVELLRRDEDDVI